MKKLVSVAVLYTLVLSTCIPAFAQGKKESRSVSPVSLGDLARGGTAFGKVEAVTDGAGVLLKWEMSSETRNVGFFVYRIAADGDVLVNPVMVLGSSARSGDRTTYGDTYQLFDQQGSVGTRYSIKAITLGKPVSSKPVVATSVKNLGDISGLSSEGWAAAANSPNKNVAHSDMDLQPELAQEVNENLQAPNLTNHRLVVAQPGVKIGVRKEGLYRVTSTELQGAGFSTAGDSTKWRLFAEGNEQAIIVGANNAYIEFYGKPIDTIESDTRVYYLIADATTAGKRMATKLVRPVMGNVVSNTYSVTAVKKERTSYVNTIQNGDLENYWGRIISSSPTTLPFTLTGTPTSGTAELTIKMQGYSFQNHNLTLSLNGTSLPAQTWTGQVPYSATLTVPASALVEGTNNLEMTGTASGDFQLFDSVAVKYERRYLAEQNAIGFFTPGYKKVDLTGFSTASVRVFDTTYDGDPAVFVNVPIQQNGSTFTAKLPSGRNFVGFAVEDSAILSSPSITTNVPSSYSSNNNSADLIIISHSAPDFMAAAETWATYRRNEGYGVKVVDVADIFDEFSYGSSSSAAIKNFLSYTYTTWRTPPGYVLILGDGSFDPRNYEGFGYFNLVPSRTVSLIFGEDPSDEALADFNGDGLAEISVGRISARSVSTINTALAKTMTFETPANQSLDRGAIFAYDLPNGYDFEGISQQVRDQLPPTVPSFMIGRGTPGSQTQLINEMNNGRYIVNYAGHGSSGLWATSTFFSNAQVPDLTNSSRPTIFTMLTCLNGFFIWSNTTESLAENLVKSPNGGAVAAWASTGETTADLQLVMALKFYQEVGAGNIPRLGDLIRDAKAALPGNADVRFSWVLLGDPMLKVH